MSNNRAIAKVSRQGANRIIHGEKHLAVEAFGRIGIFIEPQDAYVFATEQGNFYAASEYWVKLRGK